MFVQVQLATAATPRYVGRHPAGYGREPVVGDGAGGAKPGHQVGPGRTTPTPAGHTTPSPVTTTRLLSLSPGPWYRLTGKWCEEQKHCQVLRADIKYLEHFITIGRNGGGFLDLFHATIGQPDDKKSSFHKPVWRVFSYHSDGGYCTRYASTCRLVIAPMNK